MARKQVTLSISNSTDDIAKKIADKLGLSKNLYIEMVCALEILNSNYAISDFQLNDLYDNLINNKDSTNRKEFRELHKTLNKDVKKHILKFIYSLNLIPGFEFQSRKQANFNKNGEYLFYYGIKNMKGIDINQYIDNLGLQVEVIGIPTMSSDEYVYIGKEQWYRNSSNVSSKFNIICRKLSINNCPDVLKIHYKELYRLVEIIKQI